MPDLTPIATKTIQNGIWEALPAYTDYEVVFDPTISLTLDNSTKYWLVIEASTTDDSNYAQINATSTASTSPLDKYPQ